MPKIPLPRCGEKHGPSTEKKLAPADMGCGLPMVKLPGGALICPKCDRRS